MSTEFSHQMEWILLPPLTDALPYLFDNGTAFNGFQAQCDRCAAAIKLSAIRGQLSPLPANRMVLMAAARCDACQTVCDYHYLLDASGELSAVRLDGDSDGVSRQ
ncbi:hypothetical protein [Ferrimonas kyonanensis]|uniref:hypothetical protein n=1 Tax=Ferrimonas kyonanensis TaxID=364763 RepID=UPI0004287A15|nr:hypothetical protein [Ferrimonas kyonanensis]